MSTTTETVSRPSRAHGASILLTLAAILAAIVLAPVTAASAAEPLPSGTYQVAVDGGEVTLTVGADRSVTVAASDGLVVQLAFDELGQALDEFTVRSDETTYEVEIEVAQDGSYSTRVRADDDGEPGADGEVVSTVAGCAPGGLVAQSVGLPNHGTLVSAAASGLSLSVEVTDPVTSETTAITADFSSLEGAEAFCAAIAAAVPSIDEVRATFAEERAEAASDRAAARSEREAAREAVQRAREAEREAAKAARAAAREAAAAEREQEAPGHSGGPDGPASGGQEPTAGEDEAGSDTGSDGGTDGTDGSSTGDGATDTTDGGATTGSGGGTTTAGETTDATTNGNGGGKPTEPGANGKGNGK